ncbi:MAG: sigma-70 family RNA polymerase sigma factor [Clostridia bacterium]|nr:sigma-70 family RNA polymerase sigma factor [Clostridia bacterium]
MNDTEITALLFSNNPKGLEKLSKKYGRLIFTIAGNVLSNREDAEECVNDTYLAVKNRIPPQKPASLCAFVCRIARNISLSKRRKMTAAKRSAKTVPLTELEGVLCGEPIENAVSAKQLGTLLDEFLSKTDEESAAIFVRRYWFSSSVKDISRDFGMSEDTVYQKLSRTRKKLKAYLEERGVNV